MKKNDRTKRLTVSIESLRLLDAITMTEVGGGSIINTNNMVSKGFSGCPRCWGNTATAM